MYIILSIILIPNYIYYTRNENLIPKNIDRTISGTFSKLKKEKINRYLINYITQAIWNLVNLLYKLCHI